jgi:hypothetical protein
MNIFLFRIRKIGNKRMLFISKIEEIPEGEIDLFDDGNFEKLNQITLSHKINFQVGLNEKGWRSCDLKMEFFIFQNLMNQILDGNI